MNKGQILSIKKEILLPKNIAAMIVIVLCFVISTYFVYTYLPVDVDWSRYGPPQVGVDWKLAFRRACLELLNGNSPYNVPYFFNAPWILLPLLPITLLSPELGGAVIYVLNLFAFAFVIYKLKMNYWLIALFVLFSGMIINSNNANIEGFIALGFILPPQIGLFLVLAKPQIGVAVAIYWLVESWRVGGIKKITAVFLPVVIAYLVSFLLFGFWIDNSFWITQLWWNQSIWPFGIPIGVFLLAMAILKREIKFAIAASPFFAPYLSNHSWAIVWLGCLSLFPRRINFESLKRDALTKLLFWRKADSARQT